MHLNRLWLAFVVLLTACSACGARQIPDRAPTMSDPTVVRLVITTPFGGGLCSAWKVGEGLVATAGHCCKDGNIYNTAGTHASKNPMDSILSVLVDDDDNDVCILSGQVDGKVVELASATPAVGETVWTAGYPHGVFLISDGYWSGSDGDYGICSVVVNPGASGSPVLNTAGQAVGVLIGYHQGMDNLSYVGSLEALRKDVALALAMLTVLPK